MSSPQLTRPQQLQKKKWTNQEGILRVRWRATLWGKNLAETIHFWLMGSERRSAGFLAKHFQWSCQHRFPYVLQRKALKENGFFSEKINMFDILFWFWMMKFQICGRRFRQGCQKQSPRDQRNFLVKRSLEEGTTLYPLMVFLRKFWFARNSSFVSKAFYASSGTF